MRVVRQRLLARFTEVAAEQGWLLDVTDDEIARFTRPGGSGVEWWLTLDLFLRARGGMSLDPFLSVRHVEVAELSGRMLGRDGNAAQVFTALADLVRADGRPSEDEWPVMSVEDIEPVTRRVLTEVAQLGPAFYERFTTLADVLADLEKSATTNVHLAYLAVAYALSGDMSRVPEVLARLDRWVAVAPEGFGGQMAGFLARFRAHFGVQVA